MTRELRVAFEAVDRSDLGEQLRGRERGAARKLEQRRCDLDRLSFKLLVNVGDHPVELADRRDELTREPYLQLGLSASEITELRAQQIVA